MVGYTGASSIFVFVGAFVVFTALIAPTSAEVFVPQYFPSYLTGPFVRRSLPLGPALQEEIEERPVPVNYGVQDLLAGRVQRQRSISPYLQRGVTIEKPWSSHNIHFNGHEGFGDAMKKILMRMSK